MTLEKEITRASIMLTTAEIATDLKSIESLEKLSHLEQYIFYLQDLLEKEILSKPARKRQDRG